MIGNLCWLLLPPLLAVSPGGCLLSSDAPFGACFQSLSFPLLWALPPLLAVIQQPSIKALCKYADPSKGAPRVAPLRSENPRKILYSHLLHIFTFDEQKLDLWGDNNTHLPQELTFTSRMYALATKVCKFSKWSLLSFPPCHQIPKQRLPMHLALYRIASACWQTSLKIWFFGRTENCFFIQLFARKGIYEAFLWFCASGIAPPKLWGVWPYKILSLMSLEKLCQRQVTVIIKV